MAVVSPAGELLERADALAALEASLDAVRETSRGRVVFVGGEAGVGKTALVRRFCSDSPAVVWCGCDPLFTPRPLGPLLTLVRDDAAQPHELVAALARDLRGIFVLED